MVIYNLLCKKNHSFEGWFPSFEDFQKQADKKLISCPTCGTTKVEKVPHACAVHVKKEQPPAPPAKEADTSSPPAPPTAAEFKEMLLQRASLRQRKLRRRRPALRRRSQADSQRRGRRTADPRHRHPQTKSKSSPKKAFPACRCPNPSSTANTRRCRKSLKLLSSAAARRRFYFVASCIRPLFYEIESSVR